MICIGNLFINDIELKRPRLMEKYTVLKLKFILCDKQRVLL